MTIHEVTAITLPSKKAIIEKMWRVDRYLMNVATAYKNIAGAYASLDQWDAYYANLNISDCYASASYDIDTLINALDAEKEADNA